MNSRIANYLLGACGLIFLLISCSFLPQLSAWATLYPAIWVYSAFFLVMMLVGALLNKGFSQISEDWKAWRTQNNEEKEISHE